VESTGGYAGSIVHFCCCRQEETAKVNTGSGTQRIYVWRINSASLTGLSSWFELFARHFTEGCFCWFFWANRCKRAQEIHVLWYVGGSSVPSDLLDFVFCEVLRLVASLSCKLNFNIWQVADCNFNLPSVVRIWQSAMCCSAAAGHLCCKQHVRQHTRYNSLPDKYDCSFRTQRKTGEQFRV